LEYTKIQTLRLYQFKSPSRPPTHTTAKKKITVTQKRTVLNVRLIKNQDKKEDVSGLLETFGLSLADLNCLAALGSPELDGSLAPQDELKQESGHVDSSRPVLVDPQLIAMRVGVLVALPALPVPDIAHVGLEHRIQTVRAALRR
jgi:hypothetical protein